MQRVFNEIDEDQWLDKCAVILFYKYCRILWWLEVFHAWPGSHRKHLSSGIAKSVDVPYCWLCCCLSAANERECKNRAHRSPRIQLFIQVQVVEVQIGGCKILQLHPRNSTPPLHLLLKLVAYPFLQELTAESLWNISKGLARRPAAMSLFAYLLLTPLFESYAEWNKMKKSRDLETFQSRGIDSWWPWKIQTRDLGGWDCQFLGAKSWWYCGGKSGTSAWQSDELVLVSTLM